MADLCPECGKDVSGWEKKSVIAHSVEHWAGLKDDVLSREGVERRKALEAMGEGEG